MPAVKITRTLLLAALPVVAHCGGRVYAMRRPQGEAALPALVLRKISSVPLPAVGDGVFPDQRLRRDRVQVSVIATDYTTLAATSAAVMDALSCQRGTVAGILVHQIEPPTEGPDDDNDELGLCSREIDALITYTEP